MKNVIVYRDGTVIADGVRLTHVVDIEVPTFKPGHEPTFPRLIIDVLGVLTYSEHNYSNIPTAPPPPPTITHTGLYESLVAGRIDYRAYRAMMGYYYPSIPPSPEPL